MTTDALPRDPALPQLARALDADAMAEVFGALLKEADGAAVEACRIDRVKYRPRRNCSVSYRLGLRTADGLGFEQAVGTRWCGSADDAAHRHGKASRQNLRASPAGPALSHVPALQMVATWLPNDAKLDALPAMLDDETLRARWLPEIAQALVPGAHPVAQRTTLVQWVPEQRACARVELHTARGGQLRTHALYVKTDVERGGGTTHAVMQALQANPRLRVPVPVAWQPAAGLQWQQAIAGQSLSQSGSLLAPALAAEVGQTLAHLHATPVPLPDSRCLTPDALQRQRRGAACTLDGLAAPAVLSALLCELERGADGLSAPAAATLHGDPHRVNLLRADDGGVALIDLDSVRRGPAAIELGGWIAEAISLALLDGHAPRAAAAQWHALLEAYAAAGGQRPRDAELAWASAHQLLVQRAYRCVANLKPGRLAIVPMLLRVAEALARARSLDALETVA